MFESNLWGIETEEIKSERNERNPVWIEPVRDLNI